jgi:hypothetical protein
LAQEPLYAFAEADDLIVCMAKRSARSSTAVRPGLCTGSASLRVFAYKSHAMNL